MDTARKLTVSELTELIRRCLEGSFAQVLVEGELSNCRPSSTGHLYFSLKDGGAVISAVMFKNRLRSLNFEPKDGMLLRVRGSISVYNQRGTYQIICEDMEMAGTGDILAMLEKRKRLLAAEGLFDEDRKKPLPRFPSVVGVVSSPTGAAVRDILNILKRRAPGVKVIILPAPVQGAEAAPIIAKRIEQANRWRLADTLIVGRGGGSLEDLLPFSEEIVIRAVAASLIPVISAVGHEIDWAISDFAADLRAPTPSAAAELVSEGREETLALVRGQRDIMYRAVTARTERSRLLIKPFGIEEMEIRFRSILQPRLVRFDDAKEALLDSLAGRVKDIRRRLELAKLGLEAGSPLSILERGFSVVMAEGQEGEAPRLIRRASDTRRGDRLIIRPMAGIITALTEEIKEN
ncbi:MAG: exodeoxyribonuclease VII large subunit [Treponema sp.]|jgi:exodeoxyribonuclease VII large subunit|nr:exodeoxyribonuclease VII large subunit [Treponema sp.]